MIEFTHTCPGTARAALQSFDGERERAIDAILNGWRPQNLFDAFSAAATEQELTLEVERGGMMPRRVDIGGDQAASPALERSTSLPRSVARLWAVSEHPAQQPPVAISHNGARRERDGNVTISLDQRPLGPPTLQDLRESFREAMLIEGSAKCAAALFTFVSRASPEAGGADELVDQLVRVFEQEPTTSTEMARLHALQEQSHEAPIEYAVVSTYIAARFLRDAFGALHDDDTESTAPLAAAACIPDATAHAVDDSTLVEGQLETMLATLQLGASGHAVWAVWLVVEASAGWTDNDAVWMRAYLRCRSASAPLLVVVNKVELLGEAAGQAVVARVHAEALAEARGVGKVALFAGAHAASIVESSRSKGAIRATRAIVRATARQAFLDEQMAMTPRRDSEAVQMIVEGVQRLTEGFRGEGAGQTGGWDARPGAQDSQQAVKAELEAGARPSQHVFSSHLRCLLTSQMPV